MLQCNRYPGLDANEIIRLTSAIGHNQSFRIFLHCSRSARAFLHNGHSIEALDFFTERSPLRNTQKVVSGVESDRKQISRKFLKELSAAIRAHPLLGRAGWPTL